MFLYTKVVGFGEIEKFSCIRYQNLVSASNYKSEMQVIIFLLLTWSHAFSINVIPEISDGIERIMNQEYGNVACMHS